MTKLFCRWTVLTTEEYLFFKLFLMAGDILSSSPFIAVWINSILYQLLQFPKIIYFYNVTHVKFNQIVFLSLLHLNTYNILVSFSSILDSDFRKKFETGAHHVTTSSSALFLIGKFKVELWKLELFPATGIVFRIRGSILIEFIVSVVRTCIRYNDITVLQWCSRCKWMRHIKFYKMMIKANRVVRYLKKGSTTPVKWVAS